MKKPNQQKDFPSVDHILFEDGVGVGELDIIVIPLSHPPYTSAFQI
jgi:hypothetical protein